MAQDIILKVKEEPIIIRMSKQGMTGRSGPAGVKGDDGITWELSLIMEDSPDGRCTMSLYKNGNLCSDEIHYAYVQVLKYGTTKFTASNYNSNFQGTYSFEYENVRCIFVTVFQDSFMDTILCANSCNYGRSATITVGNVQSGETPRVVNTGDPIDAVFDFTLPKGDQGEVSVLRTITLPAGQDAYVQDNNPSPNVAELIFGIPNGASCAARVEDRELFIEAGTLFTPHVSEDGIISWTNNGEQDNPTSIRIGINPRGDWSSTVTYERLDYVRSGGNGYLAKKAVPAGTAVTNTTYWMQIVDKGDKGDPPNLNIGTVTAKNYGEAPTVTVENNTPSAGTHRLNFGLPMGKTPTIEIGNVEVLQQGARPTVTWTPNQTQTGGVMDWGIPNIAGSGAHVDVIDNVNTLVLDAGAIFTPSVSSAGVISWTNNASQENPAPVNIKGPKGDTGATGPAGANGADGTSATVTVVGTNTLAAGSSASVTEASGSTAQNRKLIFNIPKGDKGDPGEAGTAVPWSGITGNPTDNAALVTKLAEYLPRATTYYNTEVIDSMTDGVALVSLSSSVNASLYNALNDGYAYVIQFYYNYVGADRNHVQIAFPYSGNKTKMAWRGYRGSVWGDWQVVDVNHTHDDRYYTESETDTLLAGKAAASHTHDDAYVNVSGDTMTGNLSIPSGKLILFPSDTTSLTYATAYFRNNNQFGICYYRPGISGANVYLLPAVDSIAGNKYYNILTSKEPVTLAQGGTGGTDSGWQELTNSTVFTGTCVYRKIGAFCFLTGSIKLVNNLTADYIDLGTMPSGYRPNTNSVFGFGGGQDYPGVIRIANGGAIRFFKTSMASTWSNTANIYFQFSYFCA